MILSNGLNLDIERNKIRALFQDPVFLAEYKRTLDEIQINYFQGSKNYNDEWIDPAKVFPDGNIYVRSIEEILENFYQKFGTDYDSYAEFVALIADTLRIDLKDSIKNNLLTASAVGSSAIEPDIEEKRKALLEYLKFNAETTLAFYVDYPIVYHELETCSARKVQKFLNFVRMKKADLIEEYRLIIEECEQKLKDGKFDYKAEKFDTEKELERAKRNYQYYLSVDDLEASIPIVCGSNLSGGNALTSIFVDKRIDEDALALQIKDLQFISNIDQSIKRGLVLKNQYFDGCGIMDRGTGHYVSPQEYSSTRFCEEITDFNRRKQTNFTYDESLVSSRVKGEKYPFYGVVVTDANNPNVTEKFILYKTDNFNLGEGQTVFPVFLKHVVEDAANQTLSIMFYIFETPDISLGTQIYRIDKVPPVMSNGSDSKHTQASGDKIITNVHEHLYNLLDRLILNSDKWRELGHGDVSQNFITDVQIDNATLELLFDQKCGTSRECLKMIQKQKNITLQP